jgi:hypothetical protein
MIVTVYLNNRLLKIIFTGTALIFAGVEILFTVVESIFRAAKTILSVAKIILTPRKIISTGIEILFTTAATIFTVVESIFRTAKMFLASHKIIFRMSLQVQRDVTLSLSKGGAAPMVRQAHHDNARNDKKKVSVNLIINLKPKNHVSFYCPNRCSF